MPEEQNVLIRPLEKTDIPEARRLFGLAFGTFIGLPDPSAFMRDRDLIGTRFAADPRATLGAECAGEFLGSVFATNWGSLGFFGPLTVRPDYWDRGAGKKLLAGVMEIFDAWETRHRGLFTFSNSTKHVHLYQKFDFWPRFLTALMSKPAARSDAGVPWSKFSEVPEEEIPGLLASAHAAADSALEGLDLAIEIRSVHSQKLGDTILLWGDAGLEAFAVCHCGEGTEAGGDNCYVKFGMARTAPAFERLLDCCEAFAVSRGVSRLEAGVNLGRSAAYRCMLDRGFRTNMQGVAMHHRNDPGYNRPDAFVMDDWR
jgi:hypothetical protein